MDIKVNNLNRYWRPTRNIRFGANYSYDRPLINQINHVAKKLKVCPQTTAREALMRGLVVLAKEAKIDLSGVVLTDDVTTAEKHSESSYPQETKSQEKKVG